MKQMTEHDDKLTAFGLQVRAARVLKGWTLSQLADEAFGNEDRKGYVSEIEHGKRHISSSTVGKLSKALNLSGDVINPLLIELSQNSTGAGRRSPRIDPLQAAMLKELLKRTDASGRADSLLEEGITEKAIIRLAQRIATDTDDVGQAWLELQNAMDIAVRVQAEGQVKSNHGDFVDTVLTRVADLAKDGDYSSARGTIRDALAQADAQKSRLLNSGAEVALLDGDTVAAASLLIEKTDLDAGGMAEFETLRAQRRHHYEIGRDKGSNLDSRLAIDLAHLVLARATAPDERGAAGNELGSALRTLGERESGTERLDQAVTAYTEALKEYTRERAPLDWAMTQMNLGTALQALGERESGTARLDQAVTAYTEALEEITRERVPLNWATTQMNLGTALANLGRHENGTERLEQAVTAYANVLKENTRDRAPLDWATTQNNLGTALQSLGEREIGTARLNQAVTAYTEALKERTRDRVPMQWAMTQLNLANAEGVFFDKTNDPTHLDRAEAYVNSAREVFVEAQASQYIMMADQLLANIQSRRS
jgi:tetratricopeptide (TPR) repeat protein